MWVNLLLPCGITKESNIFKQLPRINPFLVNVPILYPLKRPENQRFSGVFRGYKMGTLAGNMLKKRIIFKDLQTVTFNPFFLNVPF